MHSPMMCRVFVCSQSRCGVRRLLKGDYKWLIYGDDDTVFYPEGIARALETHHLDADMPHFVSGASSTAILLPTRSFCVYCGHKV